MKKMFMALALCLCAVLASGVAFAAAAEGTGTITSLTILEGNPSPACAVILDFTYNGHTYPDIDATDEGDLISSALLEAVRGPVPDIPMALDVPWMGLGSIKVLWVNFTP